MYLISYDIHNDRLRLKVAKALLRFGLYRVQFSVYMGTLDESAENGLLAELGNCTQNEGWTPDDSILVFPLHQYSVDRLITLGEAPEDWSLIQQNLDTLVL